VSYLDAPTIKKIRATFFGHSLSEVFITFIKNLESELPIVFENFLY